MPQQRLTIYLIKNEVEDGDAIANLDKLSSRSFPAELPFTGNAYFKQSSPKKPDWLYFIQDGIQQNIPGVETQNASCLLIVKTHNAKYAIPFGAAHHWINDEAIERQFGLRVVLNSVEEEKIRSIDHEEIEFTKIKTRAQASTVSSMGAFGLNPFKDMVRAVTGAPKDPDFSKSLSGADQLIINCELSFFKLGQKCDECLDRFKSEAYKQSFGWIDHFRRVTDHSKILELDEILVAKISANDTASIYLAPPSIIEMQQHLGFLYPKESKGAPKHDDIRFSEYVTRKKDKPISLDVLKRDYVRHFTIDDDKPKRIPIYKCILFESQTDSALYVLTGGDWFQIENEYVAQIQERVQAIDVVTLNLPDYNSNETEKTYNIRAHQTNAPTLALLDEKTIQYGGGYSKIEVCDLLSVGRDLIHIKRGSQSSRLSHLFFQGFVSAQLLRETAFRKLAEDKFPTSHKPLLNEPFSPSEWRVIYGIITNAKGDIRTSIPFFSKQSLVSTYRQVTNLGYQVALCKISHSQ